ncbi:hypothetical protein HYPSUDRAFT_453275 [Hypholoma sublateritium FD-334 SS-4]|uniref:RlpA-like protein double-psi beta-barrel domain-containing protein n=1 Tax=Hypholoma sublateritium (strain FD-334 SS-4) TaxID=945553 RepID=A0A0D2MLW3_HYPSF|nr:hypothetical protein HYPSUDRAFT_453275 [Hypholoma sublateritium FD-334 SS-4]
MYRRNLFVKRILCLVSFLLFLAGSVLANSSKSGGATWFNTGLGACGAFSNNGDNIVALSPVDYAAGLHCFKKINVHHQGKTVTATIVDLCPSCGKSAIDLSQAAFQTLASLDLGMIEVTWEYA